MRVIFWTTISLCCLNALLIFWDMWRSSDPVYPASIALGALLLGLGGVTHRIWYHLSATLASTVMTPQQNPNATSYTLVLLSRWVAVMTSTLALAMLVVLSGIISRLMEGYPLFG